MNRTCTTGGTIWAVRAVTARSTLGTGRRGSLLASKLLGRLIALVDPDLHADAAERRTSLVEAVVDVGAQGMQRYATLAVELRSRHLCATKSPGALDTNALGAGTQRRLHALAHGTTERHPSRQLLGDALGHELRVELRRLDLEDVQLDLLAGERLELATDAVRLGATATDDDTGTSRVDVDPNAIPRPLDLHPGDTRALHALGHELADLDVFLDEVAVALTNLGAVSEPTALVLCGDSQAEAVRVYLLTHSYPTPLAVFLFVCVTRTVMWLVRLRIR